MPSKSPQDMVMVTVGISRYGVAGKQLIIYLTGLPAGATTRLQYHLRATMAVKASDSGVVAYLYYQPSVRVTAAATILEVVAAAP